ncbi:MAG: NADH-quinone oxidoreductase subunit J [Coriobacteriia bacterium]|nr:NADH-quinone oxidoreductase subunit J [Coriobacteriia bacterium]
MSGSDIALASTMVAMIACAAGVVFAREAVRLFVSLGGFLLAVAAAFLVLGHPLVAVAQVFLYVGGVLVLLLFALMVVRRGTDERLAVRSRKDPGAALISFGVFLLLALGVAPVLGTSDRLMVEPADVGAYLLGPGLVVFELAGVLLLASLLAILVIVKAGEDR